MSGGLDSSTLLAFCVSVLGSENVLAIIGDASYMISDEIEYAKNLSVKLGVCVQEIDVGLDEILNGNPSDRCYLCKFNIFSKARIEAEKKGFKYLFDGSNTDDLVEKRLGDKAKLQLNIESPFVVCNINKQKVRNLATELGLHERVNRASATCLMTRFKMGRAVSLSVTVHKDTSISERRCFRRPIGIFVSDSPASMPQSCIPHVRTTS